MKVDIQTLSRKHDFCIVYDNFDYQERPRHQVIGDTGTFYSYITGKILRASCFPNGGLRRWMLRPDVPLRLKDVVEAPGHFFDDVQTRISTYFVAEAIRIAYPAEVAAVFDSTIADIQYPRMPEWISSHRVELRIIH